jgi:hypothetical protein
MSFEVNFYINNKFIMSMVDCPVPAIGCVVKYPDQYKESIKKLLKDSVYNKESLDLNIAKVTGVVYEYNTPNQHENSVWEAVRYSGTGVVSQATINVFTTL